MLQGPDRRVVGRDPAAIVSRRAPVRDVDPAPASAASLVAQLQGTVGNRAVATMLGRRALLRHVGPTAPEEVGAEPGTGTGTAAPAGPDYAALAQQIKEAIEGLGTDEDKVYAALGACGRDAAKIAALQAAYLTLTSRSLESDIRDDFSGSELERAMKLMTAPNRQEQIEGEMKKTGSGKWALEVIEKHKVPVDWEYTGTGSFHQAGKIYLNKNTPPVAASITMMHEAQHALTFKTGKAADAAKLSREEYVKAKIADEAEAVVRSIEGAAPMVAAGADIAGSGLTAGLITKYQTAHKKAVDELKAATATMADDEAARQARTKTRDGTVTNWFHDGTFVTSTGSITYSEHYGKQWDAVHAPPTAPATLPVETPTPVINA